MRGVSARGDEIIGRGRGGWDPKNENTFGGPKFFFLSLMGGGGKNILGGLGWGFFLFNWGGGGVANLLEDTF